MTTFAIAGIQMEAPNGDNLDRVSRLIEQTAQRFPWVDMILFGELCLLGPRISHAQPMPGPIEDHMRGLAQKFGIWLIPGSLYEQVEGRIYNTSPVIDPDGEIVTRHRKLFPFLPYEQGVTAGERHTIFDVPGVGRFGLSICYDMWFPETTRTLAYLGAEVILHPSLTNTIDRDVELSIARASAATNQCYFFDINNAGALGYGRSVIFGPEGDLMHQAGQGQEVMPVNIDMGRVRATRERGIMTLGQPLKSFRDSQVTYPQYEAARVQLPGLRGLGELRAAEPAIRRGAETPGSSKAG